MKKICFLALLMLLLSSCGVPDPETAAADDMQPAQAESSEIVSEAEELLETDLEYPYWNQKYDKYHYLDGCLDCCAQFLDLYEEELLELYDFFLQQGSDLKIFDQSQYKDGRVDYYYNYEFVSADSIPWIDEVDAFWDRFQCTYIRWESEPYEMPAYLLIGLPVAIQEDQYVEAELIYAEDGTPDDIVTFAIPGHDNWLYYENLGV